ncbi:MAG: dihydroorotate dehydrogenase electron transfer subunit [Tannerella sp.]|jgi:dihydroorotate dehydrogenase electron transfer subunit|nr:dihydroorotate dehydrogenase electron transfer subunit [Tannerella sp.]
MKKYLLDLRVKENLRLRSGCSLLKLTADAALPEMAAGQFVEVRVDGSPDTFLRRPISIHYVDKALNELWLLIRTVGAGTRRLAEAGAGEIMNVLLPLGNGFSIPPLPVRSSLLLAGGGVGVAPLLYLGDTLKKNGFAPVFLLGARTREDVLQVEAFRQRGTVHIATEDGSLGEKGLITHHSILRKEQFDYLYTCGPKPMMMAVARYAQQAGVPCEVSLENTMACGLGACLCCVERTRSGHVRVCSEGPVFPADQLEWNLQTH